MDTLRDHGSLFDALRVREEIQRWREDRHWWLSQVNDVPEGEPMLLHLRLYEAFVSFFQYTIVPVSGTPDHPSSTSSQRGPDEATFLPSMKYSSDVHSALPSRSLTEVLAIEFAEFFETSETRSDIYDFKLHWKPTDEGGKQSSWMTIVKDPSKDNAFTARSSSSQALLRTVYRKQIIMLNSPSSPTSTSIFLSIAPDKVMEFSLCFSLLDSMAPLDWTHEEGKGLVDSNAKQAWKTLLSIQQLGKLLISLRERIAEGDDITQTLQQKVDMQVSLLNLMRDCVFDIYDQSKALDASAVTATSRSAKCLQAVQRHLNRLPTVINVTIEFKSPAGQVYNSVTQRLLEESEARPSPTSGRSSKLWDTKSISESSAGDNSRFSRDFVFECHEIQGKITLIFSSPLVDKTEACVSTVVCTLAKLLSRRLYELDKAARNRVYLKSKAEEIVKRR